MLADITPIILTYNESRNIVRCLSALSWAENVLVVDSYSDDDTLELCAKFANTRVIQNTFSSFAQQANFALDQLTDDGWVLSMDADYIVSPDLIEEIAKLKPDQAVSGYRIGFRYAINGRLLRGSLYPDRICLYRSSHGRYQQDGHAHKLKIDGQIKTLQARIVHDDRKSKTRWMDSQEKYAAEEASKLNATPWSELGFADKMRRLRLGPILILPYTLLVKGLLFDGAAGLEYVRQRWVAERMLVQALRRSSP